MDKREYIAVNVFCRHDENQWAHISVDTVLWDSKTPEQRYEEVFLGVEREMDGTARVENFELIAGMDGKFERRYSPELISRGECGITLSLSEMLDANVLNFEWVSRGYKSKAQMYEQEDWREQEDENAEA